MDDVALGLREALEAEHQWLLASIEEDSVGSLGTIFCRAERKSYENLQSINFDDHIFLHINVYYLIVGKGHVFCVKHVRVSLF